MKGSDYKQTILGIDMGPNSIGWALLKAEDRKPVGLIGAGVRVFEAGLDDLEMDGRGKSRNVQRREARVRRRQLERHSRRLGKLAHLVQRAGLLPDGELAEGEQRHAFFELLDKSLGSPYLLRARALDEKLSPRELGRALYHLAQRRGFLSNRMSSPEKDEEEGKVKDGIRGLEKEMSEAGARSLGEYFSRLDPHEERIRERYTSRKMYEAEFESIWGAQSKHHSGILTDDLKKNVHRAIFHQRPLKSQKHLIGDCEYEKGRRRAPWALLIAQRFRYLQRLNDLRIEYAEGERHLAPEQRSTLIEAFETLGDLKFSEMRKLLGLPGRTKFNLERGGEKKLPGNRTAARLADIFGERWGAFTDEERDAIVEDVRSIVKNDALKKRGMKTWGLDEEAATQLSELPLEEGHCSFSRRALEKLLPHLEEGGPLQTALREIYPERWERRVEPKGLLPPIKSEEFQELRNPIVERALTELRGVVNAVIKKYGKPEIIRIELARELRQPAKQRENTYKRMRENERERKRAAGKIMEEAKIPEPRPNDILKYRLADECNWQCPYTGKTITPASLLGDSPQFDIEHIIPLDRSLDNSFVNKTLCQVEENRRVKGDKTPHEAYHGTGRWEEILLRVKKFQGPARDEKLRRFKYTEKDVEEFLNSFTNRQLNDTRYASRRAKEYLGLLYGGVDDGGVDAGRNLRVQATSGGATAHFRGVWGLNAILGDGPGKQREDHRHHAVDAVVVALTDAKMVRALSNAAKRARGEGQRLFGRVEPPWERFAEDVRNVVKNIVVSHRVSRRVRGALHEETFYSPRGEDEAGRPYVHVRKQLSALTKGEVENIVDNAVRERVRAKLEELGIDDPKKVFASPENHPYLETGDGVKIPIHRVRIRKNLVTFPVGKEHRIRHVQSETNHHMEIVEDLETGKWEGHVVSMHDAYKRKRTREPIVKRDHGEGKEFRFSLACGEVIELDDGDGTRGLYVVRTVPQSKQIRFVPISDARKLEDIGKVGYTAVPESLRKRKCRKVTVSPLGEARDAND